MTPNLKYINKSIYTLLVNVLPSLFNRKLITQPVSLAVHHNFYDDFSRYQSLDKKDNCSY